MTPEQIAEAWNTTMPAGIPKARLPLSPKRLGLLRRRIREHPAWETWREGLDRIARSAFCRGENWRGWVADFSWLCQRRDAILQAAEGRYDDRVPTFTPAEGLVYREYRRQLDGRCRHEPGCATPDAHEDRLRGEWVRRMRNGGR